MFLFIFHFVSFLFFWNIGSFFFWYSISVKLNSSINMCWKTNKKNENLLWNSNQNQFQQMFPLFFYLHLQQRVRFRIGSENSIENNWRIQYFGVQHMNISFSFQIFLCSHFNLMSTMLNCFAARHTKLFGQFTELNKWTLCAIIERFSPPFLFRFDIRHLSIS